MPAFASQLQNLDFTSLGAIISTATQLNTGFNATSNAAAARVFITGAFTGTAVIEESYDGGVTWIASPFAIMDTSPGSFVTAITTAGSYTILLVGVTNFRLRVTNVGTRIANVFVVLLERAPSLATSTGSGGGGGGGTITGSVGVNNFPTQQHVVVDSQPSLTVNNGGLGALLPVPGGSTNGTVLGAPPTGAIGFKLYLQQGDVVTGTFATAAPTSAPATYSYIGPNGPNPALEVLSGTNNFYVTQTDGSPMFRWI